MYKIDDVVMHKGAGVCHIDDIRKEKLFGYEYKNYYILKPVYDNSSKILYVPVDNDNSKLREILSKPQVEELLNTTTAEESLWVENNNARKNTFLSLLNEGNQKTMLQLILELILKRDELTSKGKKFHLTDDRVLQDAKRRVFEEFAYVLSLDLTETEHLIEQKLHIVF